MIDPNLVLGFLGGLLAVLGGVWTAYRLLGHSVHRELDAQSERIGNLERRVEDRFKDAANREDRERRQHYQNEMNAREARASLNTRLVVLESLIRRIADQRRDE